MPLMNKHSVKHNINSLCYKKIIFFLGFCLSGENQHGRIAKAFKSPLDCESITHYPGTANPMPANRPKTSRLLLQIYLNKLFKGCDIMRSSNY